MSDMVYVTGVMVEALNVAGLPLEEFAQVVFSRAYPNEELTEATYVDELSYKDDYYVNHESGKIYKIVSMEPYDAYDGWYKASKKGDTIEFDLGYYNGGCSQSEALDTALEKMKED